MIWSLRYGELAPANPWNATGLEWQTPSPPPTSNFEVTPIVTEEAYAYDVLDAEREEEIPRRGTGDDFTPQGVQGV